MKQLYFGDCLDVLKDLNSKCPQGFIDLIYIDPPFNSKRNYNILFEDIDMADTKALSEAFLAIRIRSESLPTSIMTYMNS
jgi:DNA modification methylase